MKKISLKANKTEEAQFLYLVLAGLFITALVTCNLIANKFVRIDLGAQTFKVSAGILPYPLTFLITDILSEVYGRKKTNAVVIAGFFASLFTLLILYMGSAFEALENSPVSDAEYNSVFKNSWRIISASMVAYLVAQFVDIRIFHFWKKTTRGKFLWLRNNFSTITSQLLDTILVTVVIFSGLESFEFITGLIWDGWLFKIAFALADTVVIYLVIFAIRSYFTLEQGQELEI